MDRVKIGFLGSTAPSSPHLDSFRPCVPQNVEFTFVQEADAGDSLWDVKGKTEGLIRQANELIERHGWDGLVISGGPKEVLSLCLISGKRPHPAAGPANLSSSRTLRL